MSKIVLLGMDEATASKFGPYLESNSNVLKVMTQCIPIFHNLKQALYQYSPQIVYLSLSRMRYDHIKSKDIENEILNGIYEIKSDPQLSNIRIAIQTNERTNPTFLRKLAMLRISDIFLSQGKSGQMDRVAPQLSHPPNIKNISEFLSEDAPTLKVTTDDTSVVNNGRHDQQRVSQLEHLLTLANAQISVLKKKNDLTAVPRSDYDELLQQVKMLMNSKLTDAKSKRLFAEVLNSKVADGKKISKLSKIVDAQNDQILNLNNQVSQMEKRGSSTSENIVQPEKVIEAPPEEEEITDEDVQVNRLPKPKNVTKDRGHPKVNKNMPSFNFGKFVRIVTSVLLILILLFAGGMFWTHLNTRPASSSSQSNSPSFGSLLKKGKYVKAAKLYTERGVEAENAMLSDPNIKKKGDIANGIAEYNDSDAIKFDTSYFSQDFESAASIYNESTDTNLTHLIRARRIMVAYALMKSGQIAKAKSIAEPLHNDQLKERIKVYGQFYHANQILEAKIKHGHLDSEEITKAKKQINSNQSAMDKL